MGDRLSWNDQQVETARLVLARSRRIALYLGRCKIMERRFNWQPAAMGIMGMFPVGAPEKGKIAYQVAIRLPGEDIGKGSPPRYWDWYIINGSRYKWLLDLRRRKPRQAVVKSLKAGIVSDINSGKLIIED